MEIVVVGGGIVGASVAYHLGRAEEHSVVVCERGALAGETTAWSIASFKMQGDAADLAMRRDAVAQYNEFLADPRAEPWYDLLGQLVVATTEEGAESLARTVDEDADPLSGDVYLSADEIDRELIAPGLDTGPVVGGVYRPNVGYFEPRELAREFIARARERGVEFRPHTPVRAVATDGGRVVGVETDGGPLPADEVVCAAGPWTAGLARSAGVELPVRHTIAYAAEVDLGRPRVRVPPKLNHRESGAGFRGGRGGTDVVYRTGPSGDLSEYYRTASERHPDALDVDVDAVRTDLVAALEPLVPALDGAEVRSERVGLLSRTPDGHPIAGRTELPGLSVAALHAEGIQLAPAIGRTLAADLLDEDRPSYASTIAPDRFTDDPGVAGTPRGRG